MLTPQKNTLEQRTRAHLVFPLCSQEGYDILYVVVKYLSIFILLSVFRYDSAKTGRYRFVTECKRGLGLQASIQFGKVREMTRVVGTDFDTSRRTRRYMWVCFMGMGVEGR